MDLVLLIAYIIIFALQVLLCAVSIHKESKKMWLWLFLLELISLAMAVCLVVYYNGLPGYGTMPGLTYMGEALFSVWAAMAYGLMLAVSGVIYIVWRKKWCR